jgi:hypothetical protein
LHLPYVFLPSISFWNSRSYFSPKFDSNPFFRFTILLIHLNSSDAALKRRSTHEESYEEMQSDLLPMKNYTSAKNQSNAALSARL